MYDRGDLDMAKVIYELPRKGRRDLHRVAIQRNSLKIVQWLDTMYDNYAGINYFKALEMLRCATNTNDLDLVKYVHKMISQKGYKIYLYSLITAAEDNSELVNLLKSLDYDPQK